MALSDDIAAEVSKILRESWTTRAGNVVPDTEDLKLSNDAVQLNGTVLYADLAESTTLVRDNPPAFAAEVYKTYLNLCCRIIRDRGGEITAFDGDRVMAVFLGDSKNTNAVRSSLAINHGVVEILNPRIRKQYPATPPGFAVTQAVGIDTSELFVARTGIRGSNDLVWVGRAANLAAKLCALREGAYTSWITGEVFDAMNAEVKIARSGQPMWEERQWTAQGKRRIYRSMYKWSL